ncbi:hypothetical protein HanPSC8_Chr13g0570151 [Helianthus annuus]|nr:hypothetical protein HanPSC8_Chr13g0570151 [Helianthus annuus]
MPSFCRWFRVLFQVKWPEFLHVLETHDLWYKNTNLEENTKFVRKRKVGFTYL